MWLAWSLSEGPCGMQLKLYMKYTLQHQVCQWLAICRNETAWCCMKLHVPVRNGMFRHLHVLGAQKQLWWVTHWSVTHGVWINKPNMSLNFGIRHAYAYRSHWSCNLTREDHRKNDHLYMNMFIASTNGLYGGLMTFAYQMAKNSLSTQWYPVVPAATCIESGRPGRMFCRVETTGCCFFGLVVSNITNDIANDSFLYLYNMI